MKNKGVFIIILIAVGLAAFFVGAIEKEYGTVHFENIMSVVMWCGAALAAIGFGWLALSSGGK